MDNKKSDDQLSFEQALEQLETLVAKMEDGDLPLDKMINYFERGTALANLCDKKLKTLEKKIQVLARENEQGGEWVNFDPSSERSNSATDQQPADNRNSIAEDKPELLF